LDYEVGLAERLGSGERTAGWGRRSFGSAVAGVRARSITALQTFFLVDHRCSGEEEEELVIEEMTLRERESLSDTAAEEKKNL
jgi:hypothetical protein